MGELTFINSNSDKNNPTLLGLHHVLGFGKYRNKRIDTIIEIDPGYLLWLVDSECYKFYNDEVYKKVSRVASKKSSEKYKATYYPWSKGRTKLY